MDKVADPGGAVEPRTWNVGDPEPIEPGLTVHDADGVEWRQVTAWTNELVGEAWVWRRLLEYGPVTALGEAASTAVGASEPTSNAQAVAVGGPRIFSASPIIDADVMRVADSDPGDPGWWERIVATTWQYVHPERGRLGIVPEHVLLVEYGPVTAVLPTPAGGVL